MERARARARTKGSVMGSGWARIYVRAATDSSAISGGTDKGVTIVSWYAML